MEFLLTALGTAFATKKVTDWDWDESLLATGALFLGSGVATAGFGAFDNATDVGSFFGAVGNTIATGAQSLTGSFGLSEGVSEDMASATGAKAGQSLFGSSAGRNLTEGNDASGAGIVPEAGDAVDESGSPNIVKQAMQALQGYGGNNQTKAIISNAIVGGIQTYMQSRAAEKERERLRKVNVFGGPAHGGSSQPIQAPDMGQFGQSDFANTSAREGSALPPERTRSNMSQNLFDDLNQEHRHGG